MKSKLFTPVVDRSHAQTSAKEPNGMFVGVPTHPEIPVFRADTDKGEACYPLSLDGSGAPDTPKNNQRTAFTKNRIIDNY